MRFSRIYLFRSGGYFWTLDASVSYSLLTPLAYGQQRAPARSLNTAITHGSGAVDCPDFPALRLSSLGTSGEEIST